MEEDEDEAGLGRVGAYDAPGWDVNLSDNDEINITESYSKSNLSNNPIILSNITPIPSQLLDTFYGKMVLTITLDSGATLSFIRRDIARQLGLQMHPNGQLALLADEETRMASLGEVDFEVQHDYVILRIRALVMEKLQARCFVGTNFHKDNKIRTDISKGTITLHGKYTVNQSNPFRDIPTFPPSRLTAAADPEPVAGGILDWQENVHTTHQVEKTAVTERKTTPTISTPSQQMALPMETISIPVPASLISVNRIAILPSFDDMESRDWLPQVCPVTDGHAEYVNTCPEKIISHPKYAHFKTLPVQECDLNTCIAAPPSKAPKIPLSPVSAEALIRDIKINRTMLSKEQLNRLNNIHLKNKKAFDNDLSTGYNQQAGRYYATFGFKENSKPPPLKVWAPQYNRSCSELLQAKCDQLETMGVLADPSELRIDIKHVSPIFIQQKGRAKNKLLQDCTLDELRFISVQNVLNESIRPVSTLSTSHIRIFKFLSRWRYHIYADMYNSYFQLPVEKSLWGYLAINTPFRGMRVLTRAGQGLLNSDVHLDQLLMKVLGDELAEGICEVARDDIQVGGNTIDELLGNWERVLGKLNKNNLKVTAQKVRILMDDTEVYGFRIEKGFVKPSPHIIKNLGMAKVEDIKTVKQMNSWKGLYKTLLAHLPHLAFLMAPFDAATGGKNSKELFNWSPQLRAAFNDATANLENVNKTYLPRPEDKLFLKPDTAKVKLCTGWALYAAREEDNETRLLPVQYCSAKLSDYMKDWFPCELEAVGAVLSIEQVSHWINESKHMTTVMPDSMPVVRAANLMKMGKHSKNPRLQSLLTCVNRRNITFVHNSAKGGLHVVPDALSRMDTNCSCKDCGIKKFLDEIPVKVELMATQISTNFMDALFCDLEPCQLAALAVVLNNTLVNPIGSIPFGNKRAWLDIQNSNHECKIVIALKKDGNLPIKNKTNKIINRYFRECSVSQEGLLIVDGFDQRTMRHAERIVVPLNFLPTILILLHDRLSHPPTHQLQSVFEKYFFAIGVADRCKELKEGCDFCIGLDKVPKEMQEFDPKLAPAHPGSHMNADVMKRAGQKILVNTDMFSGYTTACMMDSEDRVDTVKSLIQVTTPIRNSAVVKIRTDRAPAFQSLVKSKDNSLETNGIILELGDDLNKNSNCIVDRKIQELEEELRRISPEGEKITIGQLAQAVTLLNNRVRNQKLTSSEIHFSRDIIRGENLKLDDKELCDEKIKMRKDNHDPSIKSKSKGGKPCSTPDCTPGDIVYVKEGAGKHKMKDPHIVTNKDEDTGRIEIRKVLHTHTKEGSPSFSPVKQTVDGKFLLKTKQKINQIEEDWSEEDEDEYDDAEDWFEDDDGECTNEDEEYWDNNVDKNEDTAIWDPTPSYSDNDDEHFFTAVAQTVEPPKIVHQSQGVQDRDDREHLAVDHEPPDDEPDEGQAHEDIEEFIPDGEAALADYDKDSDDEASENGEEINGEKDVSREDDETDSETDTNTNDETDDEADAYFRLDQARIPQKGDLIVMYNDKIQKWTIVRLTSSQIKYYQKIGPYYNFKCINTGTVGGQYLRPHGLWSHIDETQVPEIDLDNLVVENAIDQVDGGVTPDSLTPTSGSPLSNIDMQCHDIAILEPPLSSPRYDRQQFRWQNHRGEDRLPRGQVRSRSYSLRSTTGTQIMEGEFADDDYSDQESVFGGCEREHVLRSMVGKFSTQHDDYITGSEPDESARLFRMSQTLNLEVPANSPMAIEIEQYDDNPSAASFPEDDVGVPGYHYHRGRRRIISFSSPEINEIGTSNTTWRTRLWNWGKRFRRR